MTQHGPHLDDENRAKAAIDALAQIPPADLTAFSTDDVHGYREMTRRLCWTAIVVFSVALVCIGIALAFRPHP